MGNDSRGRRRRPFQDLAPERRQAAIRDLVSRLQRHVYVAVRTQEQRHLGQDGANGDVLQVDHHPRSGDVACQRQRLAVRQFIGLVRVLELPEKDAVTAVGIPGHGGQQVGAVALRQIWNWGQAWLPHREGPGAAEKLGLQKETMYRAEAQLRAKSKQESITLGDALERLLLQVTRKNDARGYERFKDLFEAIVAYNE